MPMHPWRRWLSRLKNACKVPYRRREQRPRYRLTMEALEARDVPTIGFTAGDIAVLDLAAASTNTTGSIIELAPTGAAQTPAFTVSIAATGNNAMRFSNSGTSSYLSDTNDGTLLAFGAYNTTDSTDADLATVAANDPLTDRAVGTLDNGTNFTLQTTYTGISTNQIRSVTSTDDAHWYIADKGGLYTNGATTPSFANNLGEARSFGGTVYISSTRTAPQGNNFNSAIGIAASPTATSFTGLSGVPIDAAIVDFYLVQSGSNGTSYDILYKLDGATMTKYSLVSGNWVSNGTYTLSGAAGLSMIASQNGVGSANIYYTTGTTVVKITDTTGWVNSGTASTTNFTVNNANNQTLYTATGGTGDVFLKGLAFAPTASTAPVVASPTKTSIGINSATLGGTITDTGGQSVTAYGVVYSTTNSNPTLGGTNVSFVAGTGSAPISTPFTVSVSGLLGNTSYFYAAYATNGVNTGYSSVDTFSTSNANPPTIDMPTNTPITSNSATLGGTVESNGGATITKTGVIYTLSSNVANLHIGGTGVTEVDTGSPAAIASPFTVSATSLTPGASYTFEAFATNSSGTTFTTATSFTTLAAPTVNTPTVASVTTNSATLGGNVASSGGSTITTTGVVYTLSSNVANLHTGGTGVTEVDTSPLVSSGTFTINATSLSPGVSYTFEAFAVNSVGTTYTTATSFTTFAPNVITAWTFPATAGAGDNSPAPTFGTGTATTLGMDNNLTNANGTGNTASDDVLSTSGTANSGFTENLWRIRGTPNNGWALSAPQYSQGIELDTSSAGFANIVFSFDWYSTTQGIRDLQVQYNTNINNVNGWTNYNSGENAAGTFIATSNDYINAQLSPLSPTIRIDLSSISAANNDANLGIRLVSAYDSTGNFPGSYASAASTPNNIVEYNNSSGNWRFGNLIFAAGTTTTTKVTASPAGSQNPNANVTFTATVTPASGTQFPTGTIAFYDGKNQIGTTQPVAQVNTSNVGTASITINNLAPGVHGDITAQFTPTIGNSFIASGPSMNVIAGDPTDNPISYTINAPQATGVDISPVVGQSFTGVVATFSDGAITSINGFSATITWATGQTSSGVIAFTGTKQETDINGAIVSVSLFTVTGTHTYATAGSFPISVLITDPNNNTATVNLTARVAYPPLKVSEVLTFNGTAATTITNQTVATFTDPGLVANMAALGINDPTTQFATSINWGDNTAASSGAITYNSGTGVFSVNGTHTYAQAGVYSVSVAVTPLTVSVERIDSSDPNNLNEVGDEIANGITDSPSADFIDQFAMGATNQAGSLYTFSLPTVATSGGNEALTNSSYSVSEGELTLSTNGQYLVTGGYNDTVSLWAPQQTFSDASVINRVIGVIDGQGNINTTTALTDTYSGDNFRGVVSTDGTQFWTSGHSGDSSDFVHYAQLGASTSTIITGPSGASNINTVEIFNGQLYEGVRSTSGALAGIYQIGTGLPTTSGQSQTMFIQVPQSNPLDVTSSNKPMSPFGFYLADLNSGNPTVNGVNVAYVADAEMGIARYDHTAQGWQFSYYINSTGSFLNSTYTVDGNGNITPTGSFNAGNPSVNADSTKAGGVRELTGRIVNGHVQLFAVTGFGTGSQPNPGESLITVTDTGASAGFTTLATDTGASVFTGVAFTPTQTVTSLARVAVHPTLTASADTYTVGAGTTLTVGTGTGILANDTGSPITIVSPLTTGTQQTALPTGYVAASGTQTPTTYTQPFTATTTHGGTVTVNPDGSFNYVPPANFTGTDSFNYTVTDAVQDYKTDLPILGTFNGVQLTAGGYGSSLYPVPGTTNEFYGLEDRGPNATAANGNIVEPEPNYDPAIGKFEFINGQAILLQYIPLKDASGNPYSGRVNSGNPTGETLVDLNGNVQPQDPDGYDSEGLVALPDGTFWVSDEYGPYITHFDATGKQISRLSPLDGTLPVELQNRLANRGLEGLTVTPDGTMLVAMMQSALNQPDLGGTDPKKIDITRIITYQLVATPGNPVGTEHEYLYQLDNPGTNKTANSELTAMDDTHFLVDERDGNEPGIPGTPYYKKLWEIDITGATDVGPNSPLIGKTEPGGIVAYDSSSTHKGLTIGPKSLEELLGTQNTATALTTLTSNGITPVNKGTTPYLDVGALITTLDPTGHFFAHDKIEGVAVVNGGTQIVISNDSDFNVGGVNGLGTGNTAPYQLVSKSTLNNAGVNDDGEYLVINLTRLPAGTSTATVTINVVNEPPVGTSNTVSTLENTPYTFAVADFGFSDPNNSPSNNLKAVEITTLPSVGTLTDNGVAVTAGQFISAADISGGLLKFTPASNASGNNYASFTFQVQDDGGTTDGGIDTDPNPKTMTINVDSTVNNHPPVLSPIADQFIYSDQLPLTIPLSADDPDGNQLFFSAYLPEQTAQQLQSSLNLHVDPIIGLDTNAYLQGEQWLRGNTNQFGQTWYFITSSGELWAWDGTPMALTGKRLAILTPAFNANPSLLTNPVNLTANVQVKGNQLTISGPANFTGSFEVIVQVTDLQSTVTTHFRVSVAARPALTLNPFADQSLSPGGSATLNLQASDANTGATLSYSATAGQLGYVLKQAYQFQLDPGTGTDDVAYAGLNVRWLSGTTNQFGNHWYFVKPIFDGVQHMTGAELWAWDATPKQATGAKLRSLDAIYYQRLDLIYNGQAQDLPFALAQSLNLHTDVGGNLWETWNNQGVKWLLGVTNRFGNSWYFVKSDGNVWAWDGTQQATGDELTTLNPDYFANIQRLYNAKVFDAQPGLFSAAVTGSQLVLSTSSKYLGTFYVLVTVNDGTNKAFDIFVVTVG